MSFPKNLLSIKSAQAFRDFCLNPKGIKIKPTSNFERERKIESFVNFPLTVHRAEKPLEKNTVVFKCEPKLTKPEIRQYLEKIYGLEITKVNTLNYMGKIKRGPHRNKYRRPDWKKAYVMLTSEVPEIFQKIGK